MINNPVEKIVENCGVLPIWVFKLNLEKNRFIKEMSTFLYYWMNWDDYEEPKCLRIHKLSESYLEQHHHQFDWDTICRTQIFSSKFYVKYREYIDLDILLERKFSELEIGSQNTVLDEDLHSYLYLQYPFLFLFLIANTDHEIPDEELELLLAVNPSHTIKYYKIPRPMLEKCCDENIFTIEQILQNQKVDESFCRTNFTLDSSFPWSVLFMTQKVSENFLRETYKYWKNAGELIWEDVIVYQNSSLSEEFILERKDEIWWELLPGTQLSEETIYKFANDLNWKNISGNPRKYSISFLANWKKRVSWELVFTNKEYSAEEMFELANLFAEEWNNETWLRISYYQEVSEEFIEQYKHKLDWFGLADNHSLKPFTESFLQRNLQNLILTKKQILPFSVLFKHKSYLLQKHHNYMAASFRLNCLVRSCQRRFIERMYSPDSLYVQKKLRNCYLKCTEEINKNG